MLERFSFVQPGHRFAPFRTRLSALTTWVCPALVAGLMLTGASPAGAASDSSQQAKQQENQQKGEEQEEQQEEQAAEEDRKKGEAFGLRIHERIMVIGDPSGIGDIPGSAHYLTLSDLGRHVQLFDDIHRFLRQVPGINIQEEDGYGLRPNIGLRGSGVDRSSKITLMEDGVLIAPAPYASPSAYYFPTAGRMEALEVRKGSSQIKYGPRTNGGALNLISTSIPYDLGLRANLGFGSDRTGKAHVSVGDSRENFGWMLETYQIFTDGYKELDGSGDRDTGFNIQDYLAKLRINSDRNSRVYQELEIKLGTTDQVSDETYLGLTDEDFHSNPRRRYAASQEDVFRSDHEQYQARYFIAPSESFDLTAVAYRNNFARNWYKLQSISGTSISKIFGDTEKFAEQLAVARGADSDPDALKVKANNREYYSQGFQTILGLRADVRRTRNQFEFGFRYHEDQEDRFQHEDGFQMADGVMVLTSRGAPGSQSNRISDAQAWAFFVQDQISWGKWGFIPGLRYESIDLVRTDFSKSDPDRAAPTRIRENDASVFIPGVGVSYDLRPEVRLFGGIHKGFSPPGPGSTEFTEAEESINYELGVGAQDRSLRVEVVGFFNDYSNLLGADTLAAGGAGTGDLFNGGEARVIGFEASVQYDLSESANSGFSLPVRVSYTFTDAEFQNSFESQFKPWGNVEAGDELPYLPRHQFYASLGVQDEVWGVDLEANYVGQMRTEAGRGPIAEGRGTDAYLVLNLSGEYAVARAARLFVGVQNLTGRAYIVARRPAGARPGLPRTLLTGIKLDF